MKKLSYLIIILLLCAGIAYAANTFGTEPSANPYPKPAVININVVYQTSALVTGDAQAYWIVPSQYNGYYLASPGAHVFTASSSGLPTIGIYNVTDSVEVLSTDITIDVTPEIDSATALTPPVVNQTNNALATADIIAIDINGAGTGTCGLMVRFLVQVNQIACDLQDKALAFFFPRLSLN